jgi:hypothetical protein
VVALLARLLVDEPLNEQLRRSLEQRVNAALQGYTVSIGKVDLNPIGFAVDLQKITVVQNARPRPPVAYVPRWTTRVDWRALFSLAVVADTTFDRPEVFLTEDQAVEEAKDPVPVSERGWQDAVTAVYPLKLNALRVRGGIVTYLQGGGAPPIRLERVDFLATNIRNVESVAGQHPSPIELDCRVFESGVLSARGRADFFAKPRPTMIADFTLQDMTLVPLASMARQSGILIDGGTLAVAGQLVQEPAATRLTLRSAVVSKPVLEYARRPETKDREDVQIAKDATQSMSVRIDELRVRDGTLTYQNPSELMPPIRFERTNLRLTSVEMPPPRAPRPRSRVELDTALLGTGSLRVRGRADLGVTPGPVGDLAFDLHGIELARFDQLTRPWGLTVAGGTLSASGQLTRDPAQTRLVIRQLGVAKPVVEVRAGHAQRRAARRAGDEGDDGGTGAPGRPGGSRPCRDNRRHIRLHRREGHVPVSSLFWQTPTSRSPGSATSAPNGTASPTFAVGSWTAARPPSTRGSRAAAPASRSSRSEFGSRTFSSTR